jgi:hypothetical protein
VPDDHHWAGRIRRTVLAHRPKQHPGEFSVTPAADDEQVCLVSDLHENRSGVSFDDVLAHFEIT